MHLHSCSYSVHCSALYADHDTSSSTQCSLTTTFNTLSSRKRSLINNLCSTYVPTCTPMLLFMTGTTCCTLVKLAVAHQYKYLTKLSAVINSIYDPCCENP